MSDTRGAGPDRPTLRVLGTRGVPAAHGGFETFAERLAVFLVSKGWRVIVYCQEVGRKAVVEDVWQGIERVRISVPGNGAASTVQFDLLSILHARKFNDQCLTLGYNTACFWPLLRFSGVRNVANMDGIEWRRAKWSRPVKVWFWLNDWIGCWVADHLVADHPEIKSLLLRRVRDDKITQIAYGADPIRDVPAELLNSMGLVPQGFMTVIARAEPENSVLECVKGFSMRPRGIKLAVLGDYSDNNTYHRQVKAAASDEVVFLGAIYEKATVQALRAHCAAYLHGHQVGGTNPSLIEAMASGNAIIAHANRFNRWVTDDRALFFETAESLDCAIQQLQSDTELGDSLRHQAYDVFEKRYSWPIILAAYEGLLDSPSEYRGSKAVRIARNVRQAFNSVFRLKTGIPIDGPISKEQRSLEIGEQRLSAK